MQYIIKPSRPSLLFYIFIIVLAVFVILAPNFQLLLKIILVLLLLYFIDSSVESIIENDGGLEIYKGHLFKRKKIVDIKNVKKIDLMKFNNKGGYGFKLHFISNKDTIHIVKQGDIEEIDADIKTLEAFFNSKYNEIPFRVFNRPPFG
jgi:hypothetical protein